ncbi:MAG: ATP-dependent sacrificial sulfur transferase LarE [Candidatus Omnitrophota bacterium]
MGKIGKLKRILARYGSAVVAFSGGVDSSFLLRTARDAMGAENILAVTAVSDTYTKLELKNARRFAKALGVRHKVIFTNELKDKNFTENPKNRCYYCKKGLFEALDKIAGKEGLKYIFDASNKDDEKDYRPGSAAKKEFGVKSPLAEAGFAKDDVRTYSRRLGLKTAGLPSMACLASRFPYGERITRAGLKEVETAEEFLKKLGIGQVRVRCHGGGIARIEVEKKDIKRFLNKGVCDKITKRLKRIGFSYIALDLEGYRTGSLNEILK